MLTIYNARIFVFIAFGILVLTKLAPVILTGFGFIDLLGALWTWTALKKD